MSNAEYISSSEYKTLLILSKYRRISDLSPQDLLKRINRCGDNQDDIFCHNIVQLIDFGQMQISIEEIEAYAGLIAEYFGYDKKKFFELCKYEGMCLTLSNNVKSNNRRVLRAIARITMAIE